MVAWMAGERAVPSTDAGVGGGLLFDGRCAGGRRLSTSGSAAVVLVLTADQGTGTTDSELLGEAPAPMRLAFGIGLAMLVLVRRAKPYPLLALGVVAWAAMGAPWGLMVAGYTISALPRRPRWFGVLVGALALVVLARMLVVSEVAPCSPSW